ncbi:MAG: adenylate/guanylate cyclase domain-containing protein [Treponema sp.]
MHIPVNYPENQYIADKTAQVVSQLSDDMLFHIPVYQIGKQLGLSKAEILNIFIRGVSQGVFILKWIYHCPICGGIAHESAALHKATADNYCTLCEKDFTNTLDDNIEIWFSVHPQLKEDPQEVYRAYTQKLENDARNGHYRTWITHDVIRGSEIIQNSMYRELLGSDVLIQDQSLQLMSTTILFTDIKGSTSMYSELGDAKAFALVREHFKILFDTVQQHNGVPVKTIGDAIMGVFIDSRNAVAAALEAQKRIISHYKTKPKQEQIEIKIGVHSGPTLVVTLNERLDYFGSTVNTAARIQNAALPNEVVISEQLFNNKKIRQQIQTVTDTVQKQVIQFKGLKDNCTIYHIKVTE